MSKYVKYIILCIIIIFSLLQITGCRTLRAPDSPYSSWESNSSNTIPETEDDTWKSIRQREIDLSSPLTLGDVIDISLRNNPNTRKAWANAMEAEARMREAKGQWLPEINLSATADREKAITGGRNVTDTNATYKTSTIDDHSKYGPAAKLTYLLLDLGGRSAEIRQASDTLLSENLKFNRAIQDLILSAETSYYDFYSNYSLVKAAQSDVEDAKKNFESAEKRYQVGLAPKVDFYQAKANYDDSLYAIEDSKGKLKDSKGRLAEVMGLSADTPMVIHFPSDEIPRGVTEENVTLFIEEALSKRPDISAERASVRAKEAEVTIANSALWPTLNTGASAEANWYHYYPDTNGAIGGVNSGVGGVTVQNWKDQEYRGYLSIDWDVFDGFQNINKKRAAEKALEAEHANLAAMELEVSRDVWSKYYNYNTAIKKFEYSRAFLDSAGISYELAFESYKKGLKDIIDLLDAQSKLSNARSKYIKSRRDVFVSVAELAHATGTIYTED